LTEDDPRKIKSQLIMSVTDYFLNLLLQVYNTFLHCSLLRDLLSLSSPQAPVIQRQIKTSKTTCFLRCLQKQCFVFILHQALANRQGFCKGKLSAILWWALRRAVHAELCMESRGAEDWFMVVRSP